MVNYSTPDDFQDLKKQKAPIKSVSPNQQLPSEFTMKVIFGYSAALQVFKSKEIGKIEIMRN